MFTPLCTIYADTSAVHRKPKKGPKGVYYVQDFNIILICGNTELQAQISWTENVCLVLINTTYVQLITLTPRVCSCRIGVRETVREALLQTTPPKVTNNGAGVRPRSSTTMTCAYHCEACYSV